MAARLKYKNIRTNGFASKKESRRFDELCLLQRAGNISNLETQIPFELIVNGKKICRYVADFRYTEWKVQGSAVVGSETIIEDAKGYRTPIFKLKAKLMKAIYGITILET